MVTVEALQRADSHLQRTHGHTRVQGVGTYVVHWGNALTKTRGRSLRYAVWLQRVSKSGGRSAKVPCTIHLRQLNSKHADSPATKVPTPARNPKERKRRNSIEQIQAAPDALRAARKLDDVHRDASHGAQNEIEVVVDTIPINLHHRSLSNIVAMQFWYSNIQRWQKLEHLRPQSSDVVKHPRAWWVFAIQAVIQENGSIFKTLQEYDPNPHLSSPVLTSSSRRTAVFCACLESVCALLCCTDTVAGGVPCTVPVL